MSYTRRLLHILGIALALGMPVAYPGRVWAWLPLAAIAFLFVLVVRRSADQWSDALGSELTDLDDGAVSDELGARLAALVAEGFTTSPKFVARGAPMATAVTPDGTVRATALEGGSLRLSTVWEDAVLVTSSGYEVPAVPHEYVQLLWGVGVAEMMDSHTEGAVILGRGYGQPLELGHQSVAERNERIKARRDSFESQRYRRVALGLALTFFDHFNQPVAVQLGLTMRRGVDLIQMLILSAVLVWGVIEWRSGAFSLDGLLIALLLFGSMLWWLVASRRRRHRFRAPAGG